jgi:UDP-N-acetylglucosamine transferase subunit ALG13
MIFIMVGTDRFPFDRLLKAISSGLETGKINEEVFAQIGSSTYIPQLFEHRDFLPFNEIVESIKKADIVVTHAGVGSILLCLSLGKIPIAFPRFKKFVEIVDDHQLEFARQMEACEKILVAYDEQELLNKISNYKSLIKTLNKQKGFLGKKDLLAFLENIVRA